MIRDLPKGLIKWYEFCKEKKALCVTGGIDIKEALCEVLVEKGLVVDRLDVHLFENETMVYLQRSHKIYDYIIAIGVLEYCHDPAKVLCGLKSMLNATGRMILGTDNRLGIRYFCGDRDVFTNRNFDSIENYIRVNSESGKEPIGRAYAKAELIQILQAAGVMNYRFYSVLPALENPQVLYAEDYLPEEELEVRVFPQYHYPDTVFMEEERLYTTLIQNGLFHAMANGYLIECSQDGQFANVRQVTVSMERGRAHAMLTVIRRDDKVEKQAVYAEGMNQIDRLIENTGYLCQHGIHMVNVEKQNDAAVMPYIYGESCTDHFRQMLYHDREAFIRELDRYWELILHSSEHVPYGEVDWEKFEPDWQKRRTDDPNKDRWKKVAFGSKTQQDDLGVILKRGYIDLVPLNCFARNGDFVFYDQELYIDNLPAKVILQRTINFIYRGNVQLERILPQKKLEEKYRLSAYKELWNQFTRCFLNDLRNDKMLNLYHKQHRRDAEMIHSNRQRINYSATEYDRLFRDIFEGVEDRKLYLFGSGDFARKFISRFAGDYEIAGIVDNDPNKWGHQLSGIIIHEPEYLQMLPANSYKIMICIKNYVSVMRQLDRLGINNYGIFDTNMNYPRRMKQIPSFQHEMTKQPPKYHVGYIAGVFDLFHIGHLNLLKRAKEQCEYLIVGVVNDEGVMENKRTTPYIPYKERIEIIRACRYVDEAVEIPREFNDTEEAYHRYHFDVQFSGSDYETDPVWLGKKAWLQKQGADLVFFPYTRSVSSTKLKNVIEEQKHETREI